MNEKARNNGLLQKLSQLPRFKVSVFKAEDGELDDVAEQDDAGDYVLWADVADIIEEESAK